MNRRLLHGLLALLLVATAGCGYHFPGRGNTLPADVHSVKIPLFKNRTAKPFLENTLTNDVLQRFARIRGLEVVKSQEDAVLEGTVSSYTSTAITYGVNDQITAYRATVGISATLKRADTGRILWKGDLSWYEDYPSSIDKTVQSDNEDAAIRQISERLAAELQDRVLSGF